MPTAAILQQEMIWVGGEILTPINSQIAGQSVASESLTGSGALADVIVGISSSVETLTGSGALIDGIVGTSSSSELLVGSGALADVIVGASLVSDNLTGAGALADVIAGVSSISGNLTGLGALADSIAGTSSLAGLLVGSGSLADSILGSAVTSDLLTGSGTLADSIFGASSSSELLAGTGSLANSIFGVASLQEFVSLSGSIAGISSVQALLTGVNSYLVNFDSVGPNNPGEIDLVLGEMFFSQPNSIRFVSAGWGELGQESMFGLLLCSPGSGFRLSSRIFASGDATVLSGDPVIVQITLYQNVFSQIGSDIHVDRYVWAYTTLQLASGVSTPWSIDFRAASNKIWGAGYNKPMQLSVGVKIIGPQSGVPQVRLTQFNIGN